MNFQSKEAFYQFVETRLKDETYLQDDDEALVQYQVRKPEPKINFPGGIKVEAVILIAPDGNLTDEDVFSLLDETAIQDIEEAISEQL